MRPLTLALAFASLLVPGIRATQTPPQAPPPTGLRYPLNLALDATLVNGATTIATKVTIQVTRQMADTARTRVTDALQNGGYPNFVNMVRPLPVVGSIVAQAGSVPIRYTREEPDGAATRLVLIANEPLYFVSQDPTKSRAGLELTVVELRIDAAGAVTGQMAGAARVKPRPGGSVVLDTYSESLAQLKGVLSKP